MVKKAHEHAAVAAQLEGLVQKRRVRRRQAGDGQGVDIGLGCLGARFEKILDKLPGETRARMLDHIHLHVDEAMKPILRVVERAGHVEDANYLRDVGPNMLRTIMEYLEQK
jgi:hypothetical protein